MNSGYCPKCRIKLLEDKCSNCGYDREVQGDSQYWSDLIAAQRKLERERREKELSRPLYSRAK